MLILGVHFFLLFFSNFFFFFFLLIATVNKIGWGFFFLFFFVIAPISLICLPSDKKKRAFAQGDGGNLAKNWQMGNMVSLCYEGLQHGQTALLLLISFF